MIGTYSENFFDNSTSNFDKVFLNKNKSKSKSIVEGRSQIYNV